MKTGIQALAVAVPQSYLAIEDLALARGVAPTKYTVGLGAREMAVPRPSEDSVALAATAVSRLLETSGVARADIGMLVVGTESGVDHSKPVASFVQGLLGLPTTMRTFDTKHACYGGTAALMGACDFIASGSSRGKSAIVVASDVARYGVHSAGEPTQGGGAVAMLVSNQPDVLAIELGTSGVFSSHVHDFWRPHGRREALVDGHYSIDCYLRAVAGAYRMWRENAGLRHTDLASALYHVPFCKMARKAHSHVRACELADSNGGAVLDDAAMLQEEADSATDFEERVGASLYLPSRIGNTYTASLYFGLASLLMKKEGLADKRIGLFSYGSGCASEFFSGIVGPDAAKVVARAGIEGLLAQRTRIDVPEYERIMALSGPEAAPAGSFRFVGLEEDRRTYAS